MAEQFAVSTRPIRRQVAEVRRDGNPDELAILLRQMHEAFGDDCAFRLCNEGNYDASSLGPAMVGRWMRLLFPAPMGGVEGGGAVR